jgi:hypothetical protein
MALSSISRFGFPVKPDPSEVGSAANSTQGFETVYWVSNKRSIFKKLASISREQMNSEEEGALAPE